MKTFRKSLSFLLIISIVLGLGFVDTGKRENKISFFEKAAEFFGGKKQIANAAGSYMFYVPNEDDNTHSGNAVPSTYTVAYSTHEYVFYFGTTDQTACPLTNVAPYKLDLTSLQCEPSAIAKVELLDDDGRVDGWSATARDYKFKLTINGPGYVNLTASINGVRTTLKVFSILEVASPAGIVNHDAGEDDTFRYLVVEEGDTNTLSFKHDSAKFTPNIDFEENSSGSILSITDNGSEADFTANKSGIAKITAISHDDQAGKTHPYELYVVVKPKGEIDTPATAASTNRTFKTLTDDNFVLYANTASARNNMKWLVYRATYTSGGVEELTFLTTLDGDNNIVTDCYFFNEITISESNGTVRFKEAKAGTYVIIGYPYDKDNGAIFDPLFEPQVDKSNGDILATNPAGQENIYVKYTVEVPLKVSNFTYDGTEKLLSISYKDKYNVLDNSNIPNDLMDKLFLLESTDSLVMKPSKTEYEAVGSSSTKKQVTMKYVTGTGKDLYNSTLRGGAYDDISGKLYSLWFTVDDRIMFTQNNEGTRYIKYEDDLTIDLQVEFSSNVAVRWESSNPDVIEIESTSLGNCTVKVKGIGTATVYARQVLANGSTLTAFTNFVVYDDFKLTYSEITMEVGGEARTVQIAPGSFLNEATWRVNVVSYENGADDNAKKVINLSVGAGTISNYVDVTAVGVGIATVVAVNPETGESAYCNVRVIRRITKVQITSKPSGSLSIGDQFQLIATITPENATAQTVIWAIEGGDSTAVSITENGKISALAQGTAVISATVIDEYGIEHKDTCNITVKSTSSTITITNPVDGKIELYVNESSFAIGYSPASATDLTWSSLDTSIATVSNKGVVTPVAVGTTYVTVTTSTGKTARITVVVKARVSGISLSVASLTLGINEYFDVIASLLPTGATAVITWSSQDESIATVTQTGRVVGRGEGTTFIYATTNGAVGYFPVTVYANVNGVELDSTEVMIDVGERYQITPIFEPENPTDDDVKWVSSNPEVATVDELGNVFGLKGGYTVVTCETADGGYRAFCIVTVYEPVLGITLNYNLYTLERGEQFKLIATVTNNDTATNKEVGWMSSNPSVIQVNQNGVISIAPGYDPDLNDGGSATITAYSVENPDVFAKCFVDIVDQKVTKVTLDVTTKTIVVGTSFVLTPEIFPSDADYQGANFTSSDNNVAIVDTDGKVTGLRVGTAEIKASARDSSGKSAICYVYVIQSIAATGITLANTEIYMVPGESRLADFAVKPNNSTDTFTFTTDNEGVATVDENGKITAVASGTAVVTIMATSGKKALLTVNVINLSEQEVTIPVYTEYSRLYVDNASGPVRWYVVDKSICEVTGGRITARKVGVTKVIANVNGRELECIVTVTP